MLARQTLFNFGAVDHINKLHHAHSSNLVLVTTDFGWREHVLTKQDAIKKAEGLEYSHAQDCYIGQNPTQRGKLRAVANISCLTNTFIDLDIYNVSAFEGLEKETILEQILKDNPDMPLPTMWADSGRGMYLIWTYKTTKPKCYLDGWQQMQNNLIRLLKPYGADPKCSDASRVLRINHTENSKTNTGAQYFPLLEPRNYPTFESLQKFSNKLTKQFRALEPKRKERTGTVVKLRSGYATKNVFTLAHQRMMDIRKLTELRGGRLTDLRKTAIFYYSVCAAWFCNDADTLRNEVAAFVADCIDNPSRYTKEGLSTVCKRYEQSEQGLTVMWKGKEYDARYRVRNSTIIENLQITKEEQSFLTCIIDKETKAARHNTKRLERARAKGVVSRTEYEKRAQSRSQLALELFTKGLTKKQIAEQTGIPFNSVKRFIRTSKGVK